MQAGFMSLQDVGEALGVDVQTVRRWIKDGRLRAFKPGKEYRIREDDLEEFLQTREVRPKAGAQPSPESEERLQAVREKYRTYAEGLNAYCDDYEGLLESGTVAQEDVDGFVRVAQTVGRSMARVARDELRDLADAMGLARWAGERIVLEGAAREKVEAEIDARLFEHSQMHAALHRYYALGRALAEAVHDEKQAEEMGRMERSLATVS